MYNMFSFLPIRHCSKRDTIFSDREPASFIAVSVLPSESVSHDLHVEAWHYTFFDEHSMFLSISLVQAN